MAGPIAMQMLGAIAFEMTCGENGDGASPPIERVENQRTTGFLNRVFRRIIFSGGYRDSMDEPNPAMVDPDYLDQDWECLKHMNSVGLDYNVFSETQREILFTDVSLRDFLAAHWAVRWASANDLEMTKKWIPDPISNRNKRQYDEFWTFAVDIRAITFEQDDELLRPFDTKAWNHLFAPLYDVNQQLDSATPIRSSELIYRTWDAMDNSDAKQAFQSEFARLVEQGDVGARSVLTDIDSGQSCFLQLADPSNPRDEFDTGEFQMGAPGDEDVHLDTLMSRNNVQRNPSHSVSLSTFRLNKYCVNQEQFQRFLAHPNALKNYGVGYESIRSLPIVDVSWYDAWCFAKWVGVQEMNGQSYQVCLPTEAQWEYACRCGESTPFTWHGREGGMTVEFGKANFDANSPWPNKDDQSELEEHRLRAYGPIDVRGKGRSFSIAENPWGFSQMHGNVCEWCWDWYDQSYYYETANAVDPKGPGEGRSRVLRGGGWNFFGRFLRSACRIAREPSDRFMDYGFRLAAIPLD